MIELTDAQAELLQTEPTDPPRVLNPRTRETFVLLRVEEYEKIATDPEYDDRPLTQEELETQAWEAGKSIGWDDPSMDVYDNLPSQK